MSIHFSSKDVAHLRATNDDPRLSIKWDIGPRGADVVRDLGQSVAEKAEALLDASGLLIQRAGASIDDTTVETTFVVADFETARDVVWSSLSEAEIGFNCRIVQEAT